MIHPYLLWLTAAAILIAAEMVTGAYVALSIGIGCAGVAIMEAITGGLLVIRDLPFFGILTIGTFLALRRIFGHKGDTHIIETDVNRY